jgi:ribosomal protein S12 methylthiotransferase
VIPAIRGDLRSRPLNSLVQEAEGLAREGVKELILVAQDLGEYGTELNPPATLMSLLEALSPIEGLEWIRLFYLHPAHVPDQLIRALTTEPKICPYLDLPIQHIDDRILTAMNRGITSLQIWSLIDRLRSAVPHLSLRSTVLVGFPGEDERQFSSLLDFIQRAQFDHLGAFAYSREEGTPAARRRGQVPEGVKEERLRQVMELQAGISREKNQRLVGSRQRILIDRAASPEDPTARGRMSRQAPEVDGVVYVRRTKGSPGEFADVKIVEADTYDLVAERTV